MDFDLDVDARETFVQQGSVRVLIDRRNFTNVAYKCQGQHVVDDWYFGTVWGFRRNDKGEFFTIPPNRPATFETQCFFQFQVRGDSIQ